MLVGSFRTVLFVWATLASQYRGKTCFGLCEIQIKIVIKTPNRVDTTRR